MNKQTEVCDNCNAELDAGQIGLCDSCQLGMACPKCESTDRIDILAALWVRAFVGEDGMGTDTDEAEDGSHDWDDTSPCLCNACGHRGTVGEFRGNAEPARQIVEIEHNTAALSLDAPPPAPIAAVNPGSWNEMRANWALVGLRAFQAETKTDDGDVLGDFLCNLFHHSQREGVDLDAAIARAKRTYEEERDDDHESAKGSYGK